MKKDNNKKSKFKKLVFSITMGIAISTSLPLMGSIGSANAQTTTTSTNKTPQLMIPEYTQAQLDAARCDSKVWTNLVQNYLNKRGLERQIQGQIQVIDQMNAAPAANQSANGSSSGSCWDNALNQLGSVAKNFDNILSIFTGGGFDFDKAADLVMNQVSNYACSQLTNFTGQVTYGLNSAINNTYSSTIGNIGINTGPINVNGSQIFGTTGSQSGTTGPAQDALSGVVNSFK